MRLRLLILSLVLVLSAPAIRAETDCEYTLQEIAELDWDGIEDFMDDALMDPACTALRESALDRIDALLAEGIAPEDMEEDDVAEMVVATTTMRLSTALWREDVSLARQLVAVLLDHHKAKAAASEEEEEEEEEEASEDEDELAAGLAQIAAVLDGSALKDWKPRLESPGQDWTLYFGSCGTGAAWLRYQMTLMPSRADAWIAVDQPELALQALLVDQWVNAVSSGMTPPRLREFAQRAFGKGRYEAEVELALAGIRIDHDLTGRRAGMPLFGLWVPVPLATRTWHEEVTRAFEDEHAIAEYLRPLLLQAREE